jgi:hypothetical protein
MPDTTAAMLMIVDSANDRLLSLARGWERFLAQIPAPAPMPSDAAIATEVTTVSEAMRVLLTSGATKAEARRAVGAQMRARLAR